MKIRNKAAKELRHNAHYHLRVVPDKKKELKRKVKAKHKERICHGEET